VPLNVIIKEVEEEAFTHNVVRKSFEVVGLSPFSEKTMINRINEKLPKIREKPPSSTIDAITLHFQNRVEQFISSHIQINKETKSQVERTLVKTGEV